MKYIALFFFLVNSHSLLVAQTLDEANNLFNSGNYALAEKAYQKVLDKNIRSFGNCSEKTLNIVSKLSGAMLTLGKYKESLGLLKSFEKCGNNLFKLYNTLGIVYNILNKPDSSTYYYKRALKTLYKQDKAQVQNNLGVLYASKNIDSSFYYYSKALGYYRTQGDTTKTTRTLNNIGKAYSIANNRDKALVYYQKSLLVNLTKKGHYHDNFLALESLLSKTEILPNLQTALKADSLVKVLQRRITKRSDKLRLTRQLNRVINAALPILESTYNKTHQKKYLDLLFYFSERAKSNILLDEIANTQSKRKLKTQTKLITLDTLQARLKTNQITLTFVRGKTKLCGFAINKESILFSSIPYQSKKRVYKRFQVQSQSIDPRPFLTNAPKLYNLLLKPFESLLKEGSHLVIIPTPEMSGIPFEAFMQVPPLKDVDKATPHEIGQALKNARYLMKDYFVSYHLSATLAFTSVASTDYPTTFTALAHSQFKGTDFESLEYTTKEARMAAGYFNKEKGKAKVYTDSSAYTGRLKGLHSKILHIATHGHYEFKGRLLKGLLLKTRSGAIDTLSANEVYDLGLRVELAVLSGCFSGQGKIETTEGVLGFNRALVYNNVPYIVFSSWRAYDKPSLDFFKLFYKYLSTGKHSYIEALTLTKRAIVSNPTYPAVWAGFMIIGE